MTILPFPSDDSEPDEQRPGGELAVPHEARPGWLRGWLERQPPLPSPTRVKQQAHWWVFDGSKKIGCFLLRSPLLAIKEAVPIGCGLGRLLSGWARWVAVADHAATVPAAEGTAKANHADKVETRRSSRRRVSLIVVVVMAGATWWAVEEHPGYVALTGVGVACVCDVVGRRGVKKVVTLPAPIKTVRGEGVPLSQITATIVNVALREGLEIGIAQPMRYDAGRREYRVTVTCLDEIKPEHLRAFERGTGFADHTIRNLATDIATVRELVIRDGDPLAEFTERPWIGTGSATIAQPLDLGVSLTEVPFALTFAGVHVKCVGASGSGKTKWFLRTLIDRLSACHDCVIWGIDLTNGPELPLWRGVIQRVAYTPEDAETLLDAVLVEIGRRGKVLSAFAEDDDPDNDVDEWNSTLGSALVIVVDEFSILAAYDGKGDKPDLLGKCETVVRTGRKHWVSMIMLTQKTGNSDFGSQTMTSQCATAVMLACDPRDTVTMVGVERRDMGYAPHMLAPGVEGDPRDAGKAYLDSPAHRTPDIYRAYAPGTTAEVKRRARQRIADGLPQLGAVPEDGVIDATEVPPILAAVERAFHDAGTPEWMATVELLAAIRSEFPTLNETTLVAAIKKPRNRRHVGGRQLRGYLYASIRSAMEEL